MPIEQIIKQDNGDGSTTVTAITSEGHSATATYYAHQCQSNIDDVINDTIQAALDKDWDSWWNGIFKIPDNLEYSI